MGCRVIELRMLHTMNDHFVQIDEIIPRILQLLTLFCNKEIEPVFLSDVSDAGKIIGPNHSE